MTKQTIELLDEWADSDDIDERKVLDVLIKDSINRDVDRIFEEFSVIEGVRWDVVTKMMEVLEIKIEGGTS